eukprot:TRINITY_DN3687_c0_g1_i2.p1 TRINITY_DN3687_c0_g1~~TRINITY_DN3687_c0_g1_i2.p1  ORF type:complete len:346 (-),score=51.13 TRINITY_DN3687_c0_g1_i2:346-1359(-)
MASKRKGARLPSFRNAAAGLDVARTPSDDRDQQGFTVIECGILSAVDKPARLYHQFSEFFGDQVEVFTAVSDPQKRPLYRATLLAKMLEFENNKIGMYLYRKRGQIEGVYCASSYEFKPDNVMGLRQKSYFLTEQACRLLKERFSASRRKSSRRRLKGEEAINLPNSSGGLLSPDRTSSPLHKCESEQDQSSSTLEDSKSPTVPSPSGSSSTEIDHPPHVIGFDQEALKESGVSQAQPSDASYSNPYAEPSPEQSTIQTQAFHSMRLHQDYYSNHNFKAPLPPSQYPPFQPRFSHSRTYRQSGPQQVPQTMSIPVSYHPRWQTSSGWHLQFGWHESN